MEAYSIQGTPVVTADTEPEDPLLKSVVNGEETAIGGDDFFWSDGYGSYSARSSTISKSSFNGNYGNVDNGQNQNNEGNQNPLQKHLDQAISLDEWVRTYKDFEYLDIITEAGWKDGQPLGPKKRYVINPHDGNVMDMRHVTVVGYGYGLPFGHIIEHLQNLRPSSRPSAFDVQDYYSNDIGDSFCKPHGSNIITMV